MKILYCATVDFHIQEFHLRNIAQLHQMGNKVDLASKGDYTNDSIYEKYNVCFSKSPFSPDNIRAYHQLKDIIQNGEYDIVSCHTPIAGFLCRYAARNQKVKVIYTAHGFHFYKGCPTINRLVYQTAERMAAKYTDILVTINREDFHAAEKFKLKTGGRVELIDGVGLDIKRIQNQKTDCSSVRNSMGIKKDDLVLLSAGELNRNKNHGFVIHALLPLFHKYPNLKYLICGEGKFRDEYEHLILEEHLEQQVFLLGFRTDVIDIMKSSDIFLMPSLREGLPLSIMEAMACGLPVVASDIRGCRDEVDDGKTGFLYAPEDADHLCAIISDMIQRDHLKETYSAQNSHYAERWDCQKIDQEILGLYAK
jgi:glycosyltransferase EpsD